jgi:hypothetical protein
MITSLRARFAYSNVQDGLNERGETRAQALASEYRASPVHLSPREGVRSYASSQSGRDSVSDQYSDKRDLSVKHKSIASSANLDGMTYIDENYNLYRSPRSNPAEPLQDHASLVEHAATPAGTSHRSNRMGDLGG